MSELDPTGWQAATDTLFQHCVEASRAPIFRLALKAYIAAAQPPKEPLNKGKPMAWMIRDDNGYWISTTIKIIADEWRSAYRDVRNLYTHPHESSKEGGGENGDV